MTNWAHQLCLKRRRGCQDLGRANADNAVVADSSAGRLAGHPERATLSTVGGGGSGGFSMCRLGRTRQHVESEVSAKIAARSRCIGTAPKGTAKACRQGKRNRVDCRLSDRPSPDVLQPVMLHGQQRQDNCFHGRVSHCWRLWKIQQGLIRRCRSMQQFRWRPLGA